MQSDQGLSAFLSSASPYSKINSSISSNKRHGVRDGVGVGGWGGGGMRWG